MKIAILEDNQERQTAMRRCLEDRFYQFDARFFDSAIRMVNFLDAHLDDTILICLDHDLELQGGSEGGIGDPGSGREVADYLAQKPPVCPVVIHTTNAPAAVGMEMVLHEAHWTTFRVLPFDDLEWIPVQWFPCVRRAIVSTAKRNAGERTRPS